MKETWGEADINWAYILTLNLLYVYCITLRKMGNFQKEAKIFRILTNLMNVTLLDNSELPNFYYILDIYTYMCKM